MIDLINLWIGAWVWPFARISAALMAMPVIGSRLVPARVRLLYAVALTVVARPFVGEVPKVDLISVSSMIILLEQVLIGVAIGLVLQTLMQVATMAGQIVGMQAGYGFTAMMDPTTGVSVTALSQLYLMMFTLLFLTLNGHLVFVEYLAGTFTLLPLGRGFYGGINLETMLSLGSWLFAGGLLLALPTLIALLMINTALGVVTRAAPQLNIFSIGFPITMMSALLLVWLTLDILPVLFSRFSEEAFGLLRALILHSGGGA